jgi:hypothetical protein
VETYMFDNRRIRNFSIVHRPQETDAPGEVGGPDRLPQARLLGSTADYQEARFAPPQLRHHRDQLRDRLARDEAPNGDEHDVVLRQPVRVSGADLEWRPRDGQRDTHGRNVGVEPAHVLQGIGRLPDDEVGSTQQASDPDSKHRVTVGRRALGRIVEVAAVEAQNVRDASASSERIPYRPRGKHEVSVDQIVAIPGDHPASAQDAHDQIGEHRRDVRRRHPPPSKHGHTNDADSVLDDVSGKSEGARREDGHFVPLREGFCEHGIDDTAPAAERRILVVAEQDSHGDRRCQSVGALVQTAAIFFVKSRLDLP